MKNIKRKNHFPKNSLRNYLYYLLFIMLMIMAPLLSTQLVVYIFFPQAYKVYSLWVLIFIIFYFVPSCYLTFISLKKWNKEQKFFLSKIYTTKQNFVFNKTILQQTIELLTLLSTFIILISGPFHIETFNNIFNSIPFTIYPVNFGFKIWDWSSDKKNTKAYFPHRKYK